MALLHQATMHPEKLDLLRAWLPGQSWSGGEDSIERLGAYRFDDPAGEVGLEGFLVRGAGGAVLHVPLTYRNAPLAGAEDHLLGTSEHSVLGTRWVYDACADPVWVVAALIATLSGGTDAEQYFVVDGRREVRASSATVRGTGTGTPNTEVPTGTVSPPRDSGPLTLVGVGALELVVVRAVGAEIAADETLVGRWPGQDQAVLVGVRRR